MNIFGLHLVIRLIDSFIDSYGVRVVMVITVLSVTAKTGLGRHESSVRGLEF